LDELPERGRPAAHQQTNFPNADDPQRISKCTFCSKWAGIRIGLLSRGDFENVTVSNCVFRDIDDSGLKIQMCEGAAMRRMVFANLVMASVPRPVFMTFCQQRAGAETRISACAHGR
jgi:polygalacturonase